MMMGYGFGGGGLVWLIIFGALVIVPFWRILPRYGIPAPVALVSVIPIGALILLWVIAFKDSIGSGKS